MLCQQVVTAGEGKDEREGQRRHQGSRVTWLSYGAWPGRLSGGGPLSRDLKEASNELSRRLRKSVPGTGNIKRREGSDAGASLVSLSDSETGGQ